MDSQVVLSREQSRRVDEIAINEYGIPGVVLMENAGRGVVDRLLLLDPALEAQQGSARGGVIILCGKGNNAGDGFVIARHLLLRGVAARTLLLCAASELTGDARINYEILDRCDAEVIDLASELESGEASDQSVAQLLDQHAEGATWIVDALLGTGARGEPRVPFYAAIEWMNRQSAKRLAIDVPSGLDCDSGEPAASTVRADVTCTFVTAKTGFLEAAAKPYVGELHVVSIGAPLAIAERIASS